MMFTGIIEETGKLCERQKGSVSARIKISCQKVLEGTKVGDSIAANGVCLTVAEMDGDGFMADVMAETARRSSLFSMPLMEAVNLERAMPADGRFGGHIVSGHIDGTGTVRRVWTEENAVWFVIEAAPELLRYIVGKGSVAVDGISLTVADVSDRDFRVSVIPHTRAVTSLSRTKPGSVVNIECDIIGKYVEKLISGPAPGGGMTEGFLRENGFLA